MPCLGILTSKFWKDHKEQFTRPKENDNFSVDLYFCKNKKIFKTNKKTNQAKEKRNFDKATT